MTAAITGHWLAILVALGVFVVGAFAWGFAKFLKDEYEITILRKTDNRREDKNVGASQEEG